MIIFAPVNVLPLIFPLSWVGWLTGMFFVTHSTKIDFHIDSEVDPELLSWYHQKTLTFVAYETTPNNSRYGGHHTCEQLAVSISWDYFQGKNGLCTNFHQCFWYAMKYGHSIFN